MTRRGTRRGTKRWTTTWTAAVLGCVVAWAGPALAEEAPPNGPPAADGAQKNAAPAAPTAKDGAAAAADAAPPAPEAATYIGADMCASCHEEQSASFAKTPHAAPLASESRPERERGCEACHGPGSIHFENGGEGHIQAFRASESARARSAPCLVCHAGESPLHDWRVGAHAKAGLACTDCHELHSGTGPSLLREQTPQLCYGCHLDVRAQFALPERHRVDEHALSCMDCHTPHGSQNPTSLVRPDDRTCLSCHNEITGPFVFEHAGLVIEGCGSCHVPHGSVNRHLLQYQQVASLCYQCHTVTPSDHVQPNFRDCTRCHVDIHGSNIDPHFLQ